MTITDRIDYIADLLSAAHDGLLAHAARDLEPDRWYVAGSHLQAAENAVRDAVKAIAR